MTISGKYDVKAHYFSNNGNQLIAETYVNVTVMTGLGSPNEKVEHFVTLLENGQEVKLIKSVQL